MLNLEQYAKEKKHIIDDGKLFALVGDVDIEYNIVSDLNLTLEQAARVAVVYSLTDCLLYGMAALESRSDYRFVMTSLAQAGQDVFNRGKQTRGSSRRHFRGAMARYTIEGLLSSYSDAIDVVSVGYGNKMQVKKGREVVEGLMQLPTFGAMTALKMSDIMCHSLGIKLKWDSTLDEWVVDNKPKKYLDQLKLWSGADVLSELCYEFRNVSMQTRGGMVDLPEVETILCRSFETRRSSVQSGRAWIGSTMYGLQDQYAKIEDNKKSPAIRSALKTLEKFTQLMTLEVLGKFHFSRLHDGEADW